jgi:hypothetical protein
MASPLSPRSGRSFSLSNPQRQLDAPLAHPHRLRLHQAEGGGISSAM